MRLALWDWRTSLKIINDREQCRFLGRLQGGRPTVTVESWYVLGPIVMRVYIVPEEGEEHRSKSSHFFFWQIDLSGFLSHLPISILTLLRIKLVTPFSDFPCFSYPKSVTHGVQLTSYNRSAPLPPVDHDGQIKTEKDVFRVCIPTWNTACPNKNLTIFARKIWGYK